MNKSKLRQAFDQYVSAYNADDPKIRLKIDHSCRVAEIASRIACAVEGADTDFAWAIGQLHDIGRFEQVKRYHTFVDAESVDHAGFGADLLFHDGLLQNLCPSLPARQQHLMELAIRYHSAYRIPSGLTPEEKMYCDIIRDADKVDIFRVLTETPFNQIYDVPMEALRTSAVSEEVKDCFRNRTAVLREKRKTPIDKLVGHICLTFELVYPVSRKIAREQGCVDRLLAFRSDNPDTDAWFAYMRDNINLAMEERLE